MKKYILLVLFINSTFLSVNIFSQVVKKLDPDIGKIKVLAFSNNSDYLTCATNGGVFSSNQIAIYSTKQWEKNKVFKSPGLTINTIRFSPNDKYIAASTVVHENENTSILVYDVFGNLVFNPGINNSAFGFDFTMDSKYLILNGLKSVNEWGLNSSDKHTWDGNATITYYNIESGEKKEFNIVDYHFQEAFKFKKYERWESFSFYPLRLINDGKHTLSESFNSQLLLWDLTNNKYDVLETKNELLHTSLDISPDGTKAAVANYSKNYWIYLWDLNSKLFTKTLKGHKDWVTSVAFSPDGNYLASASEDKTIRIWDIKTGQNIKTLKGHDDNVNAVSFSSDGKFIATGGDDGTVIIWDAGEIIPELKIFSTNFDLSIGIKRELENEKIQELSGLNDLFKPKGEFETTEEYNARIKNANDQKNAIEEKYKQKLEDYIVSKQTELQTLNTEKEQNEQKKNDEINLQIENSVKDTVVSIAEVGMYDADKNKLPVTVKGKSGYITILRSEAQSLKENWKKTKANVKKKLREDLKTFEYFDIVIIHPITKNQYKLEY